MNIRDIEDKLLGYSYEETHTYDYEGYRAYDYYIGRSTGPFIGGHKKGDKYTVEMSEWHTWAELGDPIAVPGLGIVSSVENFGGLGGAGEYAWFVLRISPEDGSEPFLVRKEGYYASYDGSTWDGAFEIVEPREKTITVYEAV
jgi:hypothetical protein